MQRGRRCGGSQAPGRAPRAGCALGRESEGSVRGICTQPSRARRHTIPKVRRHSADAGGVPEREAWPWATPRAHRSVGRAGHNYQAHEIASARYETDWGLLRNPFEKGPFQPLFVIARDPSFWGGPKQSLKRLLQAMRPDIGLRNDGHGVPSQSHRRSRWTDSQ